MKEKTGSRRQFLKNSGIVGLGFFGLYQLDAHLFRSWSSENLNEGFGPLATDSARLINLPKGFSYQVISKKGDRMDDGLIVPGRADGMGTFAGSKGKTIIIRNHENSANTPEEGAFGPNNKLLSKVDADSLYDAGKGRLPELGGTTTIVYDHINGKVVKQFLSLGGTARNCAGGVTPWKSWLSCEESTHMPGGDSTSEKEHGYVFEVPATDKAGLGKAIPIKHMGRMNHEAVAVDPQTSIVYLTEDRPDGLFYRYVPDKQRNLLQGGKLQALVVKDHKSMDTRNWESLNTIRFPVRTLFDVEWIDIDQVDSPLDNLREQGFSNGAARFARGEGIWFGKGELYFACTNGGKLTLGQVFRYIPGKQEGSVDEKRSPGKLELFIEPNDHHIVKSCDNLTVSPWGDLILCEDNPHPFIVGVTPEGKFYKFAENIGYPSEFAGGVFSPTGETFFVNIQEPGITIAIKGPWKKRLI
ncbi:MAG: alkaline phosphatase PhoX [Chitinophagaceae bacterium]